MWADKGALPDNNLAALLFRLEHNAGIDDVQDLVQTVWDSTQGPEYTELRRAFTAWVRHVLLPRALPDVVIPTVDDLLETWSLNVLDATTLDEVFKQ